MRLTICSIAAVALLISSSIALAAEAPKAPPAVKEFTLVSVLIGDVKFWLPGTIVVNQGDRVRLKLRNIVPGQENQHGFSIPTFNIVELVTRGQDKTIEFTAEKPGIYPYICQIHPAHVNGELVVLTRPTAAPPAPRK